MAREIAQPAIWDDSIYQFNLFDDFLSYTDTQLWTTIDGDSGASVAIDADGVGGRLLLTTGATDNNEAYNHTTNELFLMANGVSFRAICRLDFTEANTNDANVIFGLANAVAANELVDDGAGPATGKNNSLIYKVDGETVWRCGSALAAGTNPANQSDESAGRTNSETSAFQTLMIECRAVGAEMQVTYHVDPRGLAGFRQLKDSNGNLIMDRVTLGTATEMQLFVGAKAGGANSEVVIVDYMGCSAVRQAAAGGV